MPTGMGDDGVDGLAVLREAGGLVVAQDKDSSIVFGMPGVTVARGLADHVVGLDVADVVTRACRDRLRRSA